MDTNTSLPVKRALLIGIGRYAHLPPERQLRGPLPDVQALAEVLRSVYAFDSLQSFLDLYYACWRMNKPRARASWMR